jgi:hypothetical protein
MNDIYQLAAGTIPGRRHVGSSNLLVGKNNQDAYGMAFTDQCLVAAVFDGCSAGAHSEVGAKVAAQMLPNLVLTTAEQYQFDDDAIASAEFWRGIKENLLLRLRTVLDTMAPDARWHDAVIAQHFLFTIVGLIATRSKSVVFSIGDGVFAINERFHQLGPFPNNAPPYLGYELLENPGIEQSFLIHENVAPKFDSVVIGTDGLLELLDRAEANIPGREEKVGALSAIPNNDALFAGAESLTPWLRRLNSEVITLSESNGDLHLSRAYGLLSDDTTLIVVRRKRGA